MLSCAAPFVTSFVNYQWLIGKQDELGTKRLFKKMIFLKVKKYFISQK